MTPSFLYQGRELLEYKITSYAFTSHYIYFKHNILFHDTLESCVVDLRVHK